jgi:hypothetical protein
LVKIKQIISNHLGVSEKGTRKWQVQLQNIPGFHEWNVYTSPPILNY